MEKIKILIFSYEAKKTKDLLSFVEEIIKYDIKKQFDFRFIFPHDKLYHNSYSSVSVIKSSNIPYSLIENNNLKQTLKYKIISIADKLERKYLKFFMNMKYYTIGQLYYKMLTSMKYNLFYKSAQNSFNQYNPDIFITINDRNSCLYEAATFKLAKENNVKIFLPFVLFANPKVNLKNLSTNTKYQLLSNSNLYQKKIYKEFRKQSIDNMYYYHAYIYKFISQLDILPKNPWLMGTNDVALVAMPNKLIYNKFYKKEKIHYKFLGDISYIHLYNNFQQKEKIKHSIIHKYNLEYNKIIIISAQDYMEHNYVTTEEHWALNETVIKEALKLKNYNVILSVPPMANIELYRFLENKYPITICEERLMYILPIADIFIAPVSNTIMWAMLCQIPTILHDEINFNDDWYEPFDSVITTKTKVQLRETLVYLSHNCINFNNDWKILGRDLVFHNNIIENYKNTFLDLKGK